MATAAQDPAVAFLVLLPLGVLHLTGRGAAPLGAYWVLEQAVLRPLGGAASWALAALLGGGLLWAVGRIRKLRLPWRGGAVLMACEGVLWGVLLAPVLGVCTDLVSTDRAPLAEIGDSLRSAHGVLALAAGAGLYEELLFRAGLLAGAAVVFSLLFRALGLRTTAWPLALALAVLFSAAAFSLAHALGDAHALEPPVFLYRLLAGVLLGLLFAWRGLAVAAYAHAAYDALLVL